MGTHPIFESDFDCLTGMFRRVAKMSTNLFWLDAEMTGLNYAGEDRIMEIACIVTDKELNVLVHGPELVFHLPDDLLQSMDEWCTKTHGKSGLTDKCRESKLSIAEGDQLVAQFIEQHCAGAPLAGNSVHMDKCFMMKEMPLTCQQLSYRIVDVSSVKEICRRWYPGVFNAAPSKISKTAIGGAHTAKYDIIKSIEELKYYRENIFVDANQ